MSRINSTIKITNLQSSHIKYLVQIARENQLNQWSERDFAYFICHDSGWCRGLFVEGKLISFFLALVIQGEMDIVALATQKDLQRNGYARLLMEEALKVPHVRRWLLEVRESNQGAQKFYENFKFKKYGKRLNYYEGKENAVLMELS